MTCHESYDVHQIPSLYRLDPSNLYMLEFELLKLLPALAVVEEKIRSGEYVDGKIFLDTSSGTWAWAVAGACRILRVPFHIVTDPAVDARFRRLLEELGATVDVVHPEPGEGPQKARMRRMQQLERDGQYVLLDQYNNPAVANSYAPVAELLIEKVGQFDVIVGAVGSGASTAGITRPYRSVFPETRLVGVDTFGSVLFGQPDSKRLLRGLGNSLMPENVEHSLYDVVDWLDAPVAFAATRRLYHETRLFRGPTTGATWWVARQIALENPDARVVFISADNGWRYVDDVYNPDWLHEHGVYMDTGLMPTAPVIVSHPTDAAAPWARYHWGRSSYSEATAVRSGVECISVGGQA